jgi:hypothetical protein
MYNCVAHGSDGNIEAMSIYVRTFFTTSQTINCIIIYESRKKKQESFIWHIQARRRPSTHSLQPKHPQPGHVSIAVNILNNIIYNYTTKKEKLQKIGEGKLYEQSEDEIVDVYAQQL